VFDRKKQDDQDVQQLPGFFKCLKSAIQVGDKAKVDVLLDNGARVDDNHAPLGTLLHQCAYFADVDMVQALLSHRTRPANVNQIAGQYGTAIQAAVCGESTERTINILCQYKVDPTIVAGHYGTAVHAAIIESSPSMAMSVLEKTRQKPDLRDQQGRLITHLAAQQGQMPLLIDLQKKYESLRDFKAKDKQGRLLVHFATIAGDTEIIKHILDSTDKDMVNSPDYHGWTPLHWACKADNKYTAEFLLDQGADRTARTNDEWTPKHIALYQGNSAIADLCHFEGFELAPLLTEAPQATRSFLYTCDGCELVR
jgi:ankyrin repeat protein